jgi:hypothetical protein
LWYFHIYMYCNPNRFISSFFPFYLSPLLMVISRFTNSLFILL